MPPLIRSLNYARIWQGYMKVWGANIYHPSLDRWLYLFLHRLGMMGKLERRVIETLVLPGMTVLDVGGNVGLYTMLFSGRVGPRGKVMTLEPAPKLHEALILGVRKNLAGNVEAFFCAAGNQETEAHLIFDTFNSGNNWILGNLSENSGTRIQIRRVDDLGLDPCPDFIKIDVQGWEVQALRGMENLLLDRKPLIYCEVSDSALKLAGSSACELGQFLLEHGYELQFPVLHKKKINLVPMTLESLEEKALSTLYFDIVASAQK